MKRLGVIASVQTSHFAMDDPWFVARFGTARADERAYRWQSLLKAGILLANGSDAPIAPLIRGTESGQRSLANRARAAPPLMDSARTSFVDPGTSFLHVGRGQRQPNWRRGRQHHSGKLADLVAFEKNPYEIAASELLSLTPS